MRLPSTILAALVSAASLAAAVSPTLPVAEWPDCEAATNAALPVAMWQRRGHFDVQMSIAAGTNLVQLAFGRDADGDGELSRAETALVVGRGFGEVFVEDVAARMRYAEPLPPYAGRRGLGGACSCARTARRPDSPPRTRRVSPCSPNGGTHRPRGVSTRRGTRCAPCLPDPTTPTGACGWRSVPTGRCACFGRSLC